MITDGKQTTTLPYTKLSVASGGIKNKGVTVYALGVGRGTDRAELEEIASGSEYVFTASSFSDLQNIAPKITKRFCSGKSADHARFRGIIFPSLLVFDTGEFSSFQLHVLAFIQTVPTQTTTTAPTPTTTGILPKFVVKKCHWILLQIAQRTSDKQKFFARFKIHVSLKAAVLHTISAAK